MKRLLPYLPLFLLVLIEVILIATNYIPGTFLMGWDNVMPEFNFGANIMRNISGVWQENRGLGLYDGMAHNANVLHTIFLWLLSWVLPLPTLRYVFTFGMHFLGAIGMYVFLLQLMPKNRWVAFTGALFYQLNLATIQMFYAPLEAFSVHFASLPWLAYSLFRYYSDKTKGSLLLFYLVSLVSTPQYFVTPLLLPIGLLLGSISIGKPLRLVLKTGVGFFLIQSFWLLPYIYGIAQNAPVIAQAKINQLSSPEVFARNLAYGDLISTLLLRGFNLDFFDTSLTFEFQFFMEAWRTHVFLLLTTIFGFALAALTIFGVIRMRRFILPLVVTLVLAFVALANDLPGLSLITSFVRTHIPFLGEAFRFPFTKFSLLYAFSFGVLLSYGLSLAVEKLQKISKYISISLFILTLSVILYIAYPAFTGNFIYKNLRIPLPTQYIELSDYMNNLDPNARVGLLPQQAQWSWKHYRWGYRGSGFLWHMLAQPTMDRAFDPWSNENENYYWELSQAIYARDTQGLENVFDKYDIRYILIDDSLISTSHNRALYSDEIRAMIADITTIDPIKTFDGLTLFERTNEDVKTHIDIQTDLPSVSPSYSWTDDDFAFKELGNYLSTDSGFSYPFRSLFTKRSVNEREFSVTESDSTINITSLREATGASVVKTDSLVFDTNQNKSLMPDSVIKCGPLPEGKIHAENIEDYLRLESTNQRACLNFGMESLWHRDGYIVAVESRFQEGRPLTFSLVNQTAKHVELETYLPESPEWRTTYFILPPLAFDGVGYNVYVANDSIGQHRSVNDLRRIRVYKIPYQELVSERTGKLPELQPQDAAMNSVGVQVKHPNPAYYQIKSNSLAPNSTLILSQAFDPGWTAWQKISIFPYYRQLKSHVLVNNWANAWLLEEQPTSADQTKYEPSTNSSEKANTESRRRWDEPTTIVVFFWPQILQWIGFGLLPLPFLWMIRYRKEI